MLDTVDLNYFKGMDLPSKQNNQTGIIINGNRNLNQNSLHASGLSIVNKNI